MKAAEASNSAVAVVARLTSSSFCRIEMERSDRMSVACTAIGRGSACRPGKSWLLP